MSGLRVASAFETARTEGRSALVGYLPAAFPDVEGSIAALAGLSVGTRVFAHINNSNPALRPDGPERAARSRMC